MSEQYYSSLQNMYQQQLAHQWNTCTLGEPIKVKSFTCQHCGLDIAKDADPYDRIDVPYAD